MVDYIRVLEVLTEIADKARQYESSFFPPRVMVHRYQPTQDIVQRLTAELLKIPEISFWERKRISNFNMTTDIHLASVAGSMVERIVDGFTAETVLNDLLDLMLKRTAKVHVVAGMAGIAIDEAFALGNEVSLLPCSMLPPTRMREDMFDLDRSGKRQHRGSVVMEQPPEVAMVIDIEMAVLHSADIDNAARTRSIEAVLHKQEMALAAITLSGKDCAPFIVSTSSWIGHPSFSYSGFGSGVGYGTYPGIPPYKKGKVNGGVAGSVYSDLAKFGLNDWYATRGAV